MKNINVGIANLIISNKFRNSYFDNNSIDESKKMVSNFFETIKNSKILQLEFKVFNNIENKFIDNELIATRYIDNNIKLFEVYTIEEIEKEREKLNSFVENCDISNDMHRVALYESIDTLIKESICDYENINVDKIHESFTFILNHIKEPKKKLIETVDDKVINEDVIKLAIKKFNEKYDSLDDNDAKLLKQLIYSTDNEKEGLLESFKSETLNLLENINGVNVKENITKSIQKIRDMKYNKSSINDDIISLYELKKDIL